jgi:hypothetical protein
MMYLESRCRCRDDNEPLLKVDMDIDTELIQSKDIVFPSYSETVMAAQRAKQNKTKQNPKLESLAVG